MQLAELAWLIVRDGSFGFLVGILIGLTGIGGGAVIQPLLIIVLGLTPISAVGTGLLFAMLTKIGGAIAHIRMQNIRPRRTLCFLCGSAPSVLIVPYAINWLMAQYGATIVNHYLQCGMALVMLATAVFMVLQHLFLRETLETEAQVYFRGGPFPLRKKLSAIASGGIIGALIGATSVGGGVLIIPAMLWPA